MEKTKPISFRLPPETKEALEKASRDDARSVSSMLERIVTTFLEEKGYLTK